VRDRDYATLPFCLRPGWPGCRKPSMLPTAADVFLPAALNQRGARDD